MCRRRVNARQRRLEAGRRAPSSHALPTALHSRRHNPIKHRRTKRGGSRRLPASSSAPRCRLQANL